MESKKVVVIGSTGRRSRRWRVFLTRCLSNQADDLKELRSQRRIVDVIGSCGDGLNETILAIETDNVREGFDGDAFVAVVTPPEIGG
jgi:hypothetical protein